MTERTDVSRRRVLAAGIGIAAGAYGPAALAQTAHFEHPFANGSRPMLGYPEKRPLIVLTSRPPQLETPFEVFNDGLITPNDAFFVRYHNAGIPTSIDGDKHVIKIGGNAAGKPFELSVADLQHPVQAGRDHGRQPVLGQQPRAVHAARHRRPARQRRDGQRALDRRAAEGCARARRAEEQRAPGHLRRPRQRRSSAAATSSRPSTSTRRMDGEVMLAYADERRRPADAQRLSGQLVVPGYYGTYWVKHLSEIDVIDQTSSKASG